jgi:hypothetical protein
LSFWARIGANFSAANITAQTFIGNGTDESWQTTGAFTGNSNQLSRTVSGVTNDWTYFQFVTGGAVSGNVNQMAVVLKVDQWNGVAGANDWIEFDDIKLESGTSATPYAHALFDTELRQAQRRFYKSFPYSVAPAQNAGIAGAYTFPQVVAAATTMTTASLPAPTWMRNVIGILSTYNPVVANGEARNTTVGADCTIINNSVDLNEAHILLTTAAGSAAGNVNAVQYVLDKRF